LQMKWREAVEGAPPGCYTRDQVSPYVCIFVSTAVMPFNVILIQNLKYYMRHVTNYYN
jgi:hypothetical protein